MAKFVIPVMMKGYNGENYQAAMGPFEHSTEREFAMAVNKRAIKECSSLDQLKEVTNNLLEGWCAMNTALQRLMLENIQLRQTIDKRNVDLDAAEDLLNQAGVMLDQARQQIEFDQQSNHAKKRLWPWQR